MFTSHTADEAVEVFTREGGTLNLIYSIDRIFDDPQFKAREAITAAPDDDFGEVRVQNVVPKFTRNPGAVRHAARNLGADNESVYSEYLGLGADELQALAEKKVI